MVVLSIGLNSTDSHIYGKLSEISTYFKSKNINMGIIEEDSGSMHFLKCVISDEDTQSYLIPDMKQIFDAYIANVLYEMIVCDFQIDIINKILKDNYYYFKPHEIDEVTQKCINVLNGTNIVSNEDYLIYISRKNNVVRKLLEYIAESSEIILEGFVRFRLKDFYSELEESIEKIVEQYLIEREYNEFIKLLRYFVEIQESQIEMINIVIGCDGSYSMYDDCSNEITTELLKDLVGENPNNEVNKDDLLVSSLITAAPRYIVVHNASNIRNKEIIDTIINVFMDRVKICQGCDLCVKQHPVHKV